MRWLPRTARPALPEARLLSDEPSGAAVRWVTRAAWAMLIAFAVLVAIGNHIPKG